MKIKSLIFILAILSLVVVMAIYFLTKTNNSNNGIENKGVLKTPLAQSNNQGEVSVEVIPKSLSVGTEASFQISLDTHSIELNYDPLKISQLIDDQNNTYLPVSWNGNTGGHHLSGLLTFPPLHNKTKSVRLIISGIENLERNFEWNL